MSRSITVYVADEKLRKAAENLINVNRQMTGDNDTQVSVEVGSIGGGASYSGNFPTWTVNYPNIQYTGVTTGSSNVTVSSASSNWNGTTTGIVPPTQSNYYVQTPPTQWSTTTYPNYIGIAPQTPMTPDQVPTSELFEQMLVASIKQLNEAYNLGRVHGYIEGKKNGSDEVKKEVDNALDCDPLTYAEGVSPDGTTSSPTV